MSGKDYAPGGDSRCIFRYYQRKITQCRISNSQVEMGHASLIKEVNSRAIPCWPLPSELTRLLSSAVGTRWRLVPYRRVNVFRIVGVANHSLREGAQHKYYGRRYVRSLKHNEGDAGKGGS